MEKRRQSRVRVATLSGALALAGVFGATPALSAPAAGAEETDQRARALGFSNLLVRLEGEDQIGFADAEFRVHILERLRQRKLNVVGAENLVFGQDNAGKADLLLGGTIRELTCDSDDADELRCRVGIEWQLLDVAQKQVVYTKLSRAVVRNKPKAAMPKALVFAALDRLIALGRFRKVLKGAGRAAEVTHFEPKRVGACPASDTPMPAKAEAVMGGTLVVKSGDAVGAGFMLNADGLALTAAHVVTAGGVTVRFKDGESRAATLLRVHPKLDVALLHVAGLVPRCLPVRSGETAVGAEVYAIGSPAGEQLSFSVTRGIVSGTRVIEGTPFVQTDASINPGNSGGPLVDANGRVVAVVSWKVAGTAFEGIAFGVPVEAALRGLGLTSAERTDATLLGERAKTAPREPSKGYIEEADPVEPLSEPIAAEAPPTPESVPPEPKRPIDRPWSARDTVFWSGVVAIPAGAAMVGLSYGLFSPGSSRYEYNVLRTVNDLGFVTAVLGGLAILGSRFIPVAPVKQSSWQLQLDGSHNWASLSLTGAL